VALNHVLAQLLLGITLNSALLAIVSTMTGLVLCQMIRRHKDLFALIALEVAVDASLLASMDHKGFLQRKTGITPIAVVF